MIALAQETFSFDTWQLASINQFNKRLEEKSAEEILAWAMEQFGEGFSIGSAFGASGMALIDIAMRINPDVDIFYIDTDYFFPESLALIDRAQRHYNRPFRRVSPDMSVAEQERSHGPDLYRSNPDKCCNIRKVVPMAPVLRWNALQGSTAWVSALRPAPATSRRPVPAHRFG